MTGLLAFPWCIKPVFGFLTDRIIKSIRKTKYIVIVSSFVRIIGYSILAQFKLNLYTFHILLFIIGIGALFENIVCEYLLLLSTRKANKEKGGC